MESIPNTKNYILYIVKHRLEMIFHCYLVGVVGIDTGHETSRKVIQVAILQSSRSSHQGGNEVISLIVLDTKVPKHNS